MRVRCGETQAFFGEIGPKLAYPDPVVERRVAKRELFEVEIELAFQLMLGIFRTTLILDGSFELAGHGGNIPFSVVSLKTED